VALLALDMPVKVSAAGPLPAQGVMTLEYPGQVRVVLTTAMAALGRGHAFIRGTEGLLEIGVDGVTLTTNDGDTEFIAVAGVESPADERAQDAARRAVALGLVR
jgi:hypothetical protein